MTQLRGKLLNAALARALDNRKSQSTIRSLTIQPPNSVDFSSNDFLSLATSQELRDSYLEELRTGPSTAHLGSGGSRLLDGNSIYAEQLEDDIAAFHRAEKGLLCNSGFDANVGLFSCLPQPRDVIVYDEFIHASVHDGMRLSRAGRKIAFAHNSADALKSVIEQLIDSDEAIVTGHRNVFIAVEAVYSMDGDVAPLKDIVHVIQKLLPLGNGHLIVDEAHSNGVLGPQGRGLVSLACNGAILLCSPLIRQYLINYARPLIYTTFLSYPALAAIRASYAYLISGKTDVLSLNLITLTTHLYDLLQTLIATLPDTTDHGGITLLSIPPQAPQSPIFSLLTPTPKQLAAYCQRKGFVVRGIVPPTVPEGGERVRICLHAGNTKEQVEGLVDVVEAWVMEELGERKLARRQVEERARL
ncbi:hypothetical protein Q7P36_006117 [Cladosporium allicinum]